MAVSEIVFIFANYFLPLVVYSSVLLFLFRRRPLVALQIFISFSLAWLIGFLLKHFYYLPRPFILTGTPPAYFGSLDGSFPSNHTATTLAVSLIVLRVNKKLGFNLVVLSLLVAASRVIYSFHNWWDVLGGLLVGWLSAWFTAKIIHR